MEKFDTLRSEAGWRGLLFAVDNPFFELGVVAPFLAPDRIKQGELAIAYRRLQIDQFVLGKICRKLSPQSVQLKNSCARLSPGCLQFIARCTGRRVTKTLRPRF